MKNLRVLIVDDLSVYREAIADILHQSGYHLTITEATNGKIALDYFLSDAQAFDLITMDYQMPIMNGAEAVHGIRQKNVNIPIVGISSSLAIFQSKTLNVQHLYFLAKPVQTEKFLALLNSIY